MVYDAVNQQLDALYAKLDVLCIMCEYDKVKRELNKANVSEIDPLLVIGYLACTFIIQAELQPAWIDYWFRAQHRLVKEFGLERAHRMLECYVR